MKPIGLLFASVFFIIGCFESNDIQQAEALCIDECFTVQGNVVFDTGEPVTGVTMGAVYTTEGLFGGPNFNSLKNLATTNSLGFYEMDFVLTDSEKTRGRLEVQYRGGATGIQLCHGGLKDNNLHTDFDPDSTYIVDMVVRRAGVFTCTIDNYSDLEDNGKVEFTMKEVEPGAFSCDRSMIFSYQLNKEKDSRLIPIDSDIEIVGTRIKSGQRTEIFRQTIRLTERDEVFDITIEI